MNFDFPKIQLERLVEVQLKDLSNDLFTFNATGLLVRC